MHRGRLEVVLHGHSSVCKSKRGGSHRRNMSALVVFCWILLLTLFPDLAVARIGPGIPSTETISQEQTSRHAVQAKQEAEDIKSRVIEIMDVKTPQDLDSIFHYHENEAGESSRRGLVGSSPPTCRMKCGLCQPCKPVHIAIGSPHGVISETEYYPEVWRCQCGNRLYMP